MTGHSHRQQFLIYLCVGVLAWLVDVALFRITFEPWGVAVGQACARIGGAVTAFLLNRWITFRGRDEARSIQSQAVRYTLLLLLNWAVSVCLIVGLTRFFALDSFTAKILTDLVVIPANFWIMRQWVFPATGVREVDQ